MRLQKLTILLSKPEESATWCSEFSLLMKDIVSVSLGLPMSRGFAGVRTGMKSPATCAPSARHRCRAADEDARDPVSTSRMAEGEHRRRTKLTCHGRSLVRHSG